MEEKESCGNCAHKSVCLVRSAMIFQTFIVTGRRYELPEAAEKIDIRPSCSNWEAKDDEG